MQDLDGFFRFPREDLDHGVAAGFHCNLFTTWCKLFSA